MVNISIKGACWERESCEKWGRKKSVKIFILYNGLKETPKIDGN